MKFDMLYAGEIVAKGLDKRSVDELRKKVSGSVMRGSLWLELVDPSTGRGVQLFVSPGAPIAFLESVDH